MRTSSPGTGYRGPRKFPGDDSGAGVLAEVDHLVPVGLLEIITQGPLSRIRPRCCHP
jgi:hypothetical protein